MSQPAISVSLCNYNHGHYLDRCLRGLLHQTFTDFEVVLTDDGSTDGSQDLIREFARQDSRIKVNYFPKNQGVQAAIRDVMGRVRGRYLYGAAADDFVVNKDFFLKAMNVLENDPRPAGFYGLCGVYLAEKEKLVNGMGTAEVEGYNTPAQCCEGFLKCRSVVTSPSCIWRLGLYLENGGGDWNDLIEKMGPQADFYMGHLLAFKYGVHYERTLFACQRIYEAKSNYSANLDLWKTSRYYAEMESRLRPAAAAYPGVERDWLRWRAYWMTDTVQKSGHLVLPAA